MKLLVILALVCSYWTASAVPYVGKVDECTPVIGSAVYSSKQIIISYTADAAACGDATYGVAITGNYIDEDQTEPLKPSAETYLPGVIILALDRDLTCESIGVSVVATIENPEGLRLASDTVFVVLESPQIEIGNVDQTVDDKLEIELTKVTLPEACELKFFVQIEENEETECESYDSEKGVCLVGGINTQQVCQNVKITVTTTVKGLDIKPAYKDYNIRLPAIEGEVVVTTNDGTAVQFTPLTVDQISAACTNVQYKVVEKADVCFVSTFSVTTVYGENGENEGIEKNSTKVTKKPTAVEDVTTQLIGNYVILNWQAPSGGENCNLEYHIKKESEEESETTHLTTTTISVVEGCSPITVHIWARINNVDGDEAKVEIGGNLGTVQDLECTFTSGKVSCNWNEPKNCAEGTESLKYNVVYYDGENIQNEKEWSTTSFEYDQQCRDGLWFTVTPVLENGWTGITSDVDISCSSA